MKNSIKLTAVLLLSGFSLFAGTSAKAIGVPPAKDNIYLQALPSPFAIGVSIENVVKGNASIEITDQENHVLLTDRFSKKTVQKAYNLAELEPGDYTFTIRSNSGAITKRVHIFEASAGKDWFIFQ